MKKNVICLKLFWYKVFVDWKLKLLNFFLDSISVLNVFEITFMFSYSNDLMILTIGLQSRDYKGDREGIPHIHPIPSSRVIFRIGIKLPRARRGCFMEVSLDQTPCKTCRARGNESVKRSRAFLNIEAKWVGAHLGKRNRWTLWQPVKSV